MLLQNMIICGINGNIMKINPFVLPYACLQHIKLKDQVTNILKYYIKA